MLGQDAPIEENNNTPKPEDPEIKDDIDNVIENSGDEDLTKDDDQKPIIESKEEIPESTKSDISENSQKTEFIVTALLTDLSLESIGDNDWFNAESISIDNNKIEKIEKEVCSIFT